MKPVDCICITNIKYTQNGGKEDRAPRTKRKIRAKTSQRCLQECGKCFKVNLKGLLFSSVQSHTLSPIFRTILHFSGLCYGILGWDIVVHTMKTASKKKMRLNSTHIYNFKTAWKVSRLVFIWKFPNIGRVWLALSSQCLKMDISVCSIQWIWSKWSTFHI